MPCSLVKKNCFYFREATEKLIGYVAFYMVIVLVFFSLLLPWSYLMLGAANPFSWVFYFVIYTTARVSYTVLNFEVFKS